MRTIAIFGQALAIIVVYFFVHIPLPIAALSCIILALITLQITNYLRLHYLNQNVTELELFFQLLFDISALASLLYFTGGSANPFVSLFLLQVIIGATILSSTYTWLLAVIAISYYTLLMQYNIPIAYMYRYHIDDYFHLHVQGMWGGFVLSAILVAYFVTKLSRAIRERDATIHSHYEQILKDSFIVTLGAQATSTAHELGTPLSTIAIIAKELENEYHNLPELKNRLSLLREQVSRCKDSLSNLSASTGNLGAEGGGATNLHEYLTSMTAKWRSLFPNLQLHTNFQSTVPYPNILSDNVLEQAIFNIMTNAGEAAKILVEFNVSWDDKQIMLQIIDDGDGINNELLDKMGHPCVSNKENGHGIGLFLSVYIIAKFAGQVKLQNQPLAQGVLASITLPAM
jgi:two-component system sensor histidine kinase RegB